MKIKRKIPSEENIIKKFKMKMKEELEFFRFKEQIEILPNIIDFAYYDYAKSALIGIEFKKHDWKKVIYQANLISKKFNEVYICLLKPTRESTLRKIIDTCEKLSIGVIFYDYKGNDFEWALLSKTNSSITQINYKKNLTLEQYFKKKINKI